MDIEETTSDSSKHSIIDESNDIPSNSSPSASNVDDDYYRYIMSLHDCYINDDSQLNSISHIFPYDRKHEQKSINYPVDAFREYLNEPDATPVLIGHLRDLLSDSLDRFKYRIVDVHDDEKFNITIPGYYKGIHSIKGRRDAFIVSNRFADKDDLVGNICVGIEFKTPTAIDSTSSEPYKQLILEFIGAYMNRSNKNLPILFVSTDLKLFRFVWIPELNLETKNIRIFTTRDIRYSIRLIDEFIEYHHSILNQQIDNNNLEVAVPFDESLLDDKLTTIEKERMIKVSAAYRSLIKAPEELKSRKFNSCLTKTVYTIDIDDQPYVLKIHPKLTAVYEHLMNEERIFYYLSKQSKEIQDCVPELYFAGQLENSSLYVIVTRYVNGRHPAENWTNTSERELCKEALRKLNNAGIRHGDARTRNFIICEKRKFNDAKGCDCFEEAAIILDFGFSKLDFVPQVEDLKSD